MQHLRTFSSTRAVPALAGDNGAKAEDGFVSVADGTQPCGRGDRVADVRLAQRRF